LKNTSSLNTAIGGNALLGTTTGASNTAVGFDALFSNTTGVRNIGLGTFAGFKLTTGSNNIDIGNMGVAAESNTIRIGTRGVQTKTFIAGISGVTLTGADVVVSSTGQLGMVMSSARYKRDIHDMGAQSSGLMKLRPVSFRYKSDPAGTPQYGLVAEEVAKIYPELLVYGPDGKVQTVRYSMLSAMLLNELQKQTAELNRLSAQMDEQKIVNERRMAELSARQGAQIARLSTQVASLKAMFEQAMAPKGGARSLAARLRPLREPIQVQMFHAKARQNRPLQHGGKPFWLKTELKLSV